MIEPLRPRPTFQDWLLFAISAVFVAMGLVILPNDRDLGISTLAFFGSCLAVATSILVRKLRDRKIASGPFEATVAGGVPIQPSRGLMTGIGAWLLALGIVLVVFTKAAPLFIQLLYGFVACAGAVVLAGALLGKLPPGHLQFDPSHLTIGGRGWSALIPWDAITEVSEADYHSNPVLLIHVSGLSRITIEPREAQARAMKAIAKSQTWMGAEFAIMAAHYRIELPVLAAAVRRYASDAAARRELGKRLA